MAKLEHMDNSTWKPEGKAVDLVKSLVAVAFPKVEPDEVERSDWLEELEYAKALFAVRHVCVQYPDRDRWSVTKLETYMVTGCPGQPEGTVCYIAAKTYAGATEMQDEETWSEFAGYVFVEPRVTVEFGEVA